MIGFAVPFERYMRIAVNLVFTYINPCEVAPRNEVALSVKRDRVAFHAIHIT